MRECLCPTCGGPLDFGALKVDEDTHTLYSGQRLVRLPPREWALFEKLWRHPGRMHSHDSLHFHLYGDDIDGGPDPIIINVYVCKIRKLTKGLGFRIENVWGEGYRLVKDGRA